jgi:hypothetical protein
MEERQEFIPHEGWECIERMAQALASQFVDD